MELSSSTKSTLQKAPRACWKIMRHCLLGFQQALNKLRILIVFSLKISGLLLIGAYRTLGTQFMGGNCKFHPSCSEYASGAFQKHSPFLAIKLVAVRLFKCRPFSAGGYDPVPERRS